MKAVRTWSDRTIAEIEHRTGFVTAGRAIDAARLPRCVTIGLKVGAPAWAANRPRLRGITRIVQVAGIRAGDAWVVDPLLLAGSGGD